MKFVKTLNYIFLLAVVISIASCSKDEEVTPVNELENLQWVTTLTNQQHNIELYTASGKFQTGYNAIYFQIKNADGSLVNNAEATWTPVMHMMNKSHSCPNSSIAMKENAQSTYAGYIVFQMAGNDMEYWELTLNYSLNGTSYTANSKIEVEAAPKRVVESFMASDNSRYIVALVEPEAPIVGSNDMKALVYTMETMMSFVPVENFKLMIDPRMPGMGNHSSPNNVNLTDVSGGMYQGKLNLTMTGYWKINLQLANASGNVIKGEEVTETNESSSIYFEVEF